MSKHRTTSAPQTITSLRHFQEHPSQLWHFMAAPASAEESDDLARLWADAERAVAIESMSRPHRILSRFRSLRRAAC